MAGNKKVKKKTEVINYGSAQEILTAEAKQIYKGPMKILKSLKNGPKTVFNGEFFDIFYFILVISLVIFGLAMHYSASGSNYEQIKYAVWGIVAMIIVSLFTVNVYRNISTPIMVLATGMLIAVFFFPEKNGTHRWMGRVQPSEFGKIALIMLLAYLIDKYYKSHGKSKTFWAFLGITGVYAGAVLAEGHLSGCILFLCIGYAMMWYGNMSRKWFVIVTAVAIVLVLLVVWKPQVLRIIPFIRDYQVERIVMWKKIILNRELSYSEKINKGRQVLQSLYGIGSGGLIGKGFDNSGQKVSNLSEKANDFIYAVIGEELGFIGGLLMLLGFGALTARGFQIAKKAKTYYGALLVYGISTQMALQVIINICVATSILPNTGISLPFFSEGGSSMFFTLISMGLVLGVSKDMERNEKNAGK